MHCLNSTSCLISSIFFDSRLTLTMLYDFLNHVINAFSLKGFWDMVQEKGSRERCRSWTVLYAQCSSVLSSGFSILQSNAEALVRWGGKTKHRLISYFLRNTSAKNYRNRIVYVKIITSQMWDDFFETRCSIFSSCNSFCFVICM